MHKKSNVYRGTSQLYDEEGLQEINLANQPDQTCRIQSLLTKAKKRVQDNGVKTSLHKQIPSKQQTNRDAFLTDVDIMEPNCEEYHMGPKLDHDLMLRQMVQLQTDPLEELRIMINKTNKRLNCYGNDTRQLKGKLQQVVDQKRMTSLGFSYGKRPNSSYNTRKTPTYF